MKITKEQLNDVKDFQEEKDKFYLLSVIADSDNPLLYSDLDTYIIGRSDEGYPTWIWTKDNFTNLEQLKEDLNEYLLEGENKITCKKELYDLLKEEYELADYFEMGYLSCEEAINPQKGKGIFVRPNYADKVTLAELLPISACIVPRMPAFDKVCGPEIVRRFLSKRRNSGDRG